VSLQITGGNLLRAARDHHYSMEMGMGDEIEMDVVADRDIITDYCILILLLHTNTTTTTTTDAAAAVVSVYLYAVIYV